MAENTDDDKAIEEKGNAVLDALAEAAGIPRHMFRGVPADDIDMSNDHDGPDCKGSIVLGTGCKRCARCKQALLDLGDATNEKTQEIIAGAQAAFLRLYDWIRAGDTSPIQGQRGWTRAGFVAQHIAHSPAGEFYHITKEGEFCSVFLRPDAPACLGWLKRIDLRGETTLNQLYRLARVDPVERGVGVDVRTTSPDADCSMRRTAAGLAAPRFCGRCGLGPCQARVGEVRGPETHLLDQRAPNATVVRQDDRWLAAIKLEILHTIPELTGRQINAAAFAAVVAMKRVLNA